MILVMVIVALAILGQVSIDAESGPPSLGLRAEVRQGQMVISRVQPASVSWNAGIRPGDIVTAMDGKPVTERDNPATLLTATDVSVRSPSGQVITATVVGNTGFSGRLRTSFLVIAIAFIAVGGLVFLLTPDNVSALVALGLGGSAAAALLAAIGTSMGASWAFLVEYIAVLTFSASIFLLFLVFPINRLAFRRRRLIALICIAVTSS
jgi:hypothetical protein